MSIKHLEGLVAAPFTPMGKDESLDLSNIDTYYRLLKSNGVNGAFICGSTGEGVSLTLQEKRQVAEAWAAVAGEDTSFHIIQLVGGTCVADCIELAKHARDNGLYAVAYTAPFYFKTESAKVVAEIGRRIAAAVEGLPVYYYHIPVLTGVNIKMIDLLPEVADIENFAGVKFTHEDFEDFEACVKYAGGKYDMLWGRDETWHTALHKGAKGAVGSTFNYAAPLYHQITEAHNNGDEARAAALQEKSVTMISLLGKYGGITTGKSYMKYLGLDCGGFRLPLVNMNEAAYQAFSKDVAFIGFAEYCSKLPEAINA